MSNAEKLLCLICSSPTGGDNKSSVSRIFDEEEDSWNKLCSYWLFPPRNFKKVFAVCKDFQFCKGCVRVVKDVIKIHAQVVSLEERIKSKAQGMAKILSESSEELEELEDSLGKKLKCEDVWLKFKDPVIENYKTYIKPPKPTPTSTNLNLPTVAMISYKVGPNEEEYYQEVEVHVKSSTAEESLVELVPTSTAFTLPGNETDDDDLSEVEANIRLPSTGRIECPKCPFSVPYDQRNSAGDAYRTRSNAKNGVNSHYTTQHNPIKRRDFQCDDVNNDDRFYQCTLCPFKSFIRPGASSSDTRRLAARENDALNILSRHCIDQHENTKSADDMTATGGGSDSTRTEGVDSFTCPADNCNFASTVPECSNKTPSRKVENKRPALCKLGTHYLRTHEFPNSKILGKHPCLEVIAGKESFKCPRCDFRAELNANELTLSVSKTKGNSKSKSESHANNRRRVASMSFMRHYVSHVYPT